MLEITPDLQIDDSELIESFVRSSAPGGQHVNKVSSAVQLRFNVEACRALSEDVKERLKKLAAGNLNREGELVILAQRFRSQDRNRKDARERLIQMIREALVEPKSRVATKPSRQAKQKRLEAKKRQSQKKRTRKLPSKDFE